jgi:hypothetical protein
MTGDAVSEGPQGRLAAAGDRAPAASGDVREVAPAGRAAPLHAPQWQAPGEFEQLKEINAGAGRLATIASLVLVGLTFTSGNAVIHRVVVFALSGRSALAGGQPALTPAWGASEVALYFTPAALVGVAGVLVYALYLLIMEALEPAVPAPDAARTVWQKVILQKQGRCRRVGGLLFAAVATLVLVWACAMFSHATIPELARMLT